MKGFTLKETNICKGAACMLLLFHHLFYYEPRWGMFYHIFGIEPPIISVPAVMAKVCVAIFVILSGYGLMKSAEKSEKKGVIFVYKHLVKLLLQYWFIFIIFVSLGFVFWKNPIDVYGMGSKGIIKLIIDFLGLANIMGTSTMNATWWYMGAAILLYLMFPLLRAAMQKVPYIVLAVSAAICFWGESIRFYNAVLAWIFPFTIGMLLADRKLLDMLLKTKRYALIGIASFVGCVVCAFLREKFDLSIKIDTFFGLSIIIFTSSILRKIKYINSALEFIGVHSANIFMMHSFIIGTYFKSFIYCLWYPILIYAALLGICLLISVGLEKLKKIVKYDKLQGLLLNIGGN